VTIIVLYKYIAAVIYNNNCKQTIIENIKKAKIFLKKFIFILKKNKKIFMRQVNYLRLDVNTNQNP